MKGKFIFVLVLGGLVLLWQILGMAGVIPGPRELWYKMQNYEARIEAENR
jgi:hypothetical protein